MEPLSGLSGSHCSVLLHDQGDKPRAPYTPENPVGAMEPSSWSPAHSQLYELLCLGTCWSSSAETRKGWGKVGESRSIFLLFPLPPPSLPSLWFLRYSLDIHLGQFWTHDPPASTFHMLRLQQCSIMPGSYRIINISQVSIEDSVQTSIFVHIIALWSGYHCPHERS